MKYINNEKELSEVISSNESVIIKYTAKWCGPCKTIQILLDQISDENPEIKIYGIDVDIAEDLADKASIRSIPTLKFYKNSQYLGEILGTVNKNKILEMFKNDNK